MATQLAAGPFTVITGVQPCAQDSRHGKYFVSCTARRLEHVAGIASMADPGEVCPGERNRIAGESLGSDGIWQVTCTQGQVLLLLRGDQLVALAQAAVPGTAWAKIVAFLHLDESRSTSAYPLRPWTHVSFTPAPGPPGTWTGYGEAAGSSE